MLNPKQFTVYRGLYMPSTAPDADDEEIAGRIQPRRGVPEKFHHTAVALGSHWTTEPEVARTFALHASTNLEHRGPGARSTRPRTGVVLEAQVNRTLDVPVHDRLSAGYGEKEVSSPGYLDIESLHAHVHHLPPETSVHRHPTFLRSIKMR